MVAFPRLSPVIPRLANPLVPPVAAAVAGGGIAALFALVPAAVLEEWVWASGVPALIAAAAPPLGTTARAAMALVGGAVAAAVTWSVCYLLFGPGGLLVPRTAANSVPVIRRADAHPDAPPRRPMTAAEMGTPLMEVAPARPPIEQPIPVDLDQPLAAFDPAAIPDEPLPPPAKIEPLARMPLAPGERIDTYVLSPPAPSAAPEPRRAVGSARPSIDALLRRLEEVPAQRTGVPAR